MEEALSPDADGKLHIVEAEESFLLINLHNKHRDPTLPLLKLELADTLYNDSSLKCIY
jgi:hypothetical protein